MKKINLFFLCLAFQISLFPTIQAQYEANWASLDKRQTPAWFEDAKFGVFIHWGVYSVPSWATNSNADGFGSGYTEWYWQRLTATKLKIHPEFVAFHKKNYGDRSYQDFVQDFKAELFNPDDWANMFEKAGLKYVVLTSKHHEGFTMWQSPQSWNWNAVDVGPHRDLAGDLSKAVKAKNLKMGFYYSLYEWFNPTYKTNVKQYVDERMLPQMKDLVTRYQPDVLWTDGEWDHPAKTWRSEEYLAWLFNESAVKNSIVVNDRWGNDTKGKHGSFKTSEYGQGSSDTEGDKRPWEECRGMGESFGYNRNENLEVYRTSEQLVHQLIETVARGGNLLLNIGPTADGRIPVIMQQRLSDMGGWLKVNGEGIYSTRKWEKAPQYTKETELFFTKKDKDLFAITRKWADVITIQNVAKPLKVNLLGFKGDLKFTDAHSNSAVCTPTRYGILTGRYAWRSPLKSGVLWSYDKHLIPSERLTAASLLKIQGYETACVGKWHLGLDWAKDEKGVVDFTKQIKNTPNANGFDYFFGITASLDIPPYFYIQNDKITATKIDSIDGTTGKRFWRNGPIGDDFKHEEVLPVLTEKALSFIQKQDKNTPYFLYFPLPAPHTPILPTKEYLGKSGTNEYGDFVLMVDDVVGKIMAAVKESGEENNTIIIFTSDNGCSPMADFKELAQVGHNPSYVFRGTKADIFEGGHHVPFIVKWQGRVAAHSTSSKTICLTDFLATCADIVNEKLPDNAGEDSYSLLPLLTNKPTKYKRKATVLHSVEGYFAIQKGKWKLEMCAGSGGWSAPKPGKEEDGLLPIQLYNLENDIGETKNVQAAYPSVVKELTALLTQYIKNGRSTKGSPQKNDGVFLKKPMAWMKD